MVQNPLKDVSAVLLESFLYYSVPTEIIVHQVYHSTRVNVSLLLNSQLSVQSFSMLDGLKTIILHDS